MAVESHTATTGSDVVADALQATVIDLNALALVGKHAHWNVVGPTFRDLHLQLDEIVDAARLGTDRAAERLAALGTSPDGRPSSLTDSGVDLPAGPITTEAVIDSIGGLLDDLSRRLRDRIMKLADPDPISQGILIDVAEELEKQAWMLRSQRRD